MSKSELVRYSRDGDQFHYLWGARRCLGLLSPQSGLVAITVEGASPEETKSASASSAGEEIIDIAEYFGSESLSEAKLVRYCQCKHSTSRPNDEWTPSELKKTFAGFAKRYKNFIGTVGAAEAAERLELWFVSNRPVPLNIIETIHDAGAGLAARHAEVLKKLETYTSLAGESLSTFCKLLRFEAASDLWEQRNLLTQYFSGYLADCDIDGPAQLKELVTRKATSEFAENPSITKTDVLRALKTEEDRLYPAPSLITPPSNAIPREQEPELLREIVSTTGRPIIVHAEGGVGKSIFASRIAKGLPEGSECILYDCFGNGQYRSASGYRHRHREALVQIANELAAHGLCHPLIPTPHADASAYIRAFIYRLKQAIRLIQGANPNALLCIVVDAADNAQIAADEIGEPRSFARDLIREQLPDGVRLVTLCRSHRQTLLDPPPSVISIELKSFSRSETRAHLLQFYPAASEHDVDEFHALSSHNPRVQALALSAGGSLSEILQRLGPEPTTVEAAIGGLLSQAIDRLKDSASKPEKEQIDRICAGLAALRPLIPISVLSSLSGVEASAVRSFALDLGRPIVVSGSTIQFFDEPVETWFRERYRPSASALKAFVNQLVSTAKDSSYVASCLPPMMLEAGMFDELVALALSSDGLPEGNPVERRDVELQRLQFAIKACLRSGRLADAAKLALKAGGEGAGDERQRKLIRENTDLAGSIIHLDQAEELVSRRNFDSTWMGSHNVYEAGLLSCYGELRGRARSHLRMAHEWLHNWFALPDEKRRHEHVTSEDIATLAIVHLNIHGPRACARELRGWRPRQVCFEASRLVAERLVDHQRYDDLDRLALEARNNIWLILPIISELRKVNRNVPSSTARRAVRLALTERIHLGQPNAWDRKSEALGYVTDLVEAAYQLSVADANTLIALLDRYLPKSPPNGLASRFGDARYPHLRAYTLRAELLGQPVELKDVAPKDLREQLEGKDKSSHRSSRDLQEFREDIGALLPWHSLRSRATLSRIPAHEVGKAITQTLEASAKAEGIQYREVSHTADEIARLWHETLTCTGTLTETSLGALDRWRRQLRTALFIPTLLTIARINARDGEHARRHALALAAEVHGILTSTRQHAESESDTYVSLARSILAASKSDAQEYFAKAVEVASKIGDENLHRWIALLDVADQASDLSNPAPQAAYRLARCAELTYDYVARDKHFAWEGTIHAIAGLCPSSAYAILSRWRDRSFGNPGRLLPELTSLLIQRRVIDARDAAPLLGFQGWWDEADLARAAVAASESTSEREGILRHVWRYASLANADANKLADIVSAARTAGIELVDAEAFLARAEQRQAAMEARKTRDDLIEGHTKNGVADEARWTAVFSGEDIASLAGLDAAYRRFRDGDPPFYDEAFFREAIQRLPAGQEPQFIEAIGAANSFSIYGFRSFLAVVPEEWRDRLATKGALANALRSYCKTYCLDLSKNRYYEVLPFKVASELTGTPEPDILRWILEGIAETTEVVDPQKLFTLVGLIAPLLDSKEASDVLTYGLSLLDELLRDTDGDGAWRPALLPPASVQQAIAGYIWGALASPGSETRWEAAHAARGACTLSRAGLIDALISLAKEERGGPYVDQRLYFYGLHARQWLLIALRAAAVVNPSSLSTHVGYLLSLLMSEPAHVLIRQLVADTLTELERAGYAKLSEVERKTIQSCNQSPFAPLRKKNGEIDAETDGERKAGEDDYFFGIDMGPYWLAPLGRVFGKSQKLVERKAIKVIRDQWGYAGSSRWDADERHRLKLYQRGDTTHSHSSRPKADELNFYLSYHAMMVVAAELLQTTAIRQHYEEDQDGFAEWLTRHSPTRRDGLWLADRRDLCVLDEPCWKLEAPNTHWRWSINRSDFDDVLLREKDRLPLWGSWNSVSGDREETVTIRSACVAPRAGQALLRALQTAQNFHDYGIPSAGDSLELDSGIFQLKGWVSEGEHGSGIDADDPWSGSISFPPAAPAPSLVRGMKLASDSETRRWRVASDDDGDVVSWSRTWGERESNDRDRSSPERGSLLQVSWKLASAALRTHDKALIIKVEIDRRVHKTEYSREIDDGIPYFCTYARIFLLQADGEITSL